MAFARAFEIPEAVAASGKIIKAPDVIMMVASKEAIEGEKRLIAGIPAN